MIIKSNGFKFAYLIHVSVDNGSTSNSNKMYKMEQIDANSFKAEWGRVGSTPSSQVYSMSKWDSTLKSKTGASKGYKDVTELIVEEDSTDVNVKQVDIKDSSVRDLIAKLQAYANNTIKTNYRVSQNSVTIKQVEEAQSILSDITADVKIGANIKALNDKLLKLYTVIPRTMRDVRDYMLSEIKSQSDLDKANKFISNEQDTLDTMAGQVALLKQQSTALNETKEDNIERNILDQMGLTIKPVSDSKTLDMIKGLMGPNAHQLKKVFEVSNKTTQAKFDAHVKRANNKTTQLFWHGSRNQNFFFILQQGLLLRPANAQINGKMFGFGTYFSSIYKKSLGYTSLSGSYWTRGNENTGYLALFDVHVGNQHHIHRHDSSCCNLDYNNLKKKGDFDSVYAHGGYDLVNDEFIVYQESQCTIKYLIEVGN